MTTGIGGWVVGASAVVIEGSGLLLTFATMMQEDVGFLCPKARGLCD
jgi:hypothetical protein